MSLNALHCVETPYLSLTWFHLDLNVKRRGGKKRGGGSHFWLDVRKRGGGCDSDAYCVQQGG